MASLAELLRAYPIGPGDTIYVDTGNYIATSNALLPPSESGTAAAPILIIGPTNGGTVTINRNNTAPGTDIINDTGGSYVTIENLGMTGAYDGIDLSGTSTAVTLLNDTIFGNANGGIVASNTVATYNAPAIANLTIANSTIHDNTGSGINLQNDLLSATLTNDLVYNTTGDGIDISTPYGNATITGGDIYDNTLIGINLVYDGTVSGAQVHGNGRDGIDGRNNYSPVVVSGNTVYANANAGIALSGGTAIANTIYGQLSTSRSALELTSSAQGIGNTIYGSRIGISADGGSPITGNLVYGNSSDGIYLTGGYYNTVSGNIIYGDQIGIAGGGQTLTIENNLIYDNVATGIAITSGSTIGILDNTIYQSVGQALTVSNASTVTVENNILWVDTGTIVSIGSGSQAGFLSAFNLFNQGTNATPATLGLWLGTAEPTLAAWQAASTQDVTGSKTGNPNFVNIAGADQILGGPGTPVGAGADDDFELKGGSPAIDAGNAYAAPVHRPAGPATQQRPRHHRHRHRLSALHPGQRRRLDPARHQRHDRTRRLQRRRRDAPTPCPSPSASMAPPTPR